MFAGPRISDSQATSKIQLTYSVRACERLSTLISFAYPASNMSTEDSKFNDAIPSAFLQQLHGFRNASMHARWLENTKTVRYIPSGEISLISLARLDSKGTSTYIMVRSLASLYFSVRLQNQSRTGAP